jgi:hypothetical protein
MMRVVTETTGFNHSSNNRISDKSTRMSNNAFLKEDTYTKWLLPIQPIIHVLSAHNMLEYLFLNDDLIQKLPPEATTR